LDFMDRKKSSPLSCSFSDRERMKHSRPKGSTSPRTFQVQINLLVQDKTLLCANKPKIQANFPFN
jgi:hypothetical protein